MKNRAVITAYGADDCPTQIKRIYEQLGCSAGHNLDALNDVLTDPNWVQGPAVVIWLSVPKNLDGWRKTLCDTLTEAAAKRPDLEFITG